MGAAVEISAGTIPPKHLEGMRVLLGQTELGVLDGTAETVRFDIPSGKHVLYLKDGLTSTAVAFRVQARHCVRVVVKDTDAGMLTAVFGGWFGLERAGERVLDESTPGAEEITEDEVSVDA